MFKPKVQASQKPDASTQPKSLKQDSASTLSEDAIRTRAYQIFESGDRNENHEVQDWIQAETELMELVGGK